MWYVGSKKDTLHSQQHVNHVHNGTTVTFVHPSGGSKGGWGRGPCPQIIRYFFLKYAFSWVFTPDIFGFNYRFNELKYFNGCHDSVVRVCPVNTSDMLVSLWIWHSEMPYLSTMNDGISSHVHEYDWLQTSAHWVIIFLMTSDNNEARCGSIGSDVVITIPVSMTGYSVIHRQMIGIHYDDIVFRSLHH